MTAADSGSPRVTSRLTEAQQRLSPQTPRELHLVSLGIRMMMMSLGILEMLRDKRERRWFVLERPRRDTNGGSDDDDVGE